MRRIAVLRRRGKAGAALVGAASHYAAEEVAGSMADLGRLRLRGAVVVRALAGAAALLDLALVVVHAEQALVDSGVYVPAARRSFEQHSFLDADELPELSFKQRDDWLGARSAGSNVFRLLPDRLAELGEPWD